MLEPWQVIVVVVATGLVAAATGLLRTDPLDDNFIDFWAPELRRRLRAVLAGVHFVVGVVGAGAALGLGWIPTTEEPWWVTNALIYAAASVALFRADVSGFKLGTATTGRSLLKLIEDRTRAQVDRSIDSNVGDLVHVATDKNLVVAAFLVMEQTYQGEIGYRELGADISKAERVLDPDMDIASAPSAEAIRAWLRGFIVNQVKSDQLIIRGYRTWVEARDDWSTDAAS